jgi:hypothetical protein
VEGSCNTVMNLRGPENVGKFVSNCTTGGFSRRAQLRRVSYYVAMCKPLTLSDAGFSCRRNLHDPPVGVQINKLISSEIPCKGMMFISNLMKFRLSIQNLDVRGLTIKFANSSQ